MEKFKVGDIIRGTNSEYVFTDSKMTKGKIITIKDSYMRIEILEHEDKSVIGEVCSCTGVRDKEFEIISESLLCNVGDKLRIKSENYGHEFKIGEVVIVIEYDKSDSGYKVTNGTDEYWVWDPEFDKINDEDIVCNSITQESGILCDFIFIGDMTIALPKGTPVGISNKHPDDEYSKEIGQAISQFRMMNIAKEEGLI